ncbi:MAG: hypothetical protein HYX69_19205 [Planctomycetia bacterium]|nr:hypothetical protein [Planctomycetia bacterium]
MSLRLRALGVGLALAATCVGCAKVPTTGHSPLMSAALVHDTVALEKISVRRPLGDPVMNDEMWNEIDEQCLPAELRTRLAANGFRAGIVRAQLPEQLDQLLREEPHPRPACGASAAPVASAQSMLEAKTVDVVNESKVRRGLLQTRAGHRATIITAGENARIPQISMLLRGDDGRVTGRSFEKCMSVLALRAFPEHDGRVRVELVPEIEHGDARQLYTASDGMFKIEFRPATEVFKDLKLDAALSPGEMLVLASRADRSGSLGHHFLTEQLNGAPREQKLILIRLAHSPGDDRFHGDDLPPAAR